MLVRQGPQKNCLELRFYMKHPNGDALCKKFQTVFVRKSNLWFILPSHWFRGKITLHSISLNLKMTNAIILFPSRTSKYFLYQIIVRFLFRILVPLCNSGLKFWQEPNLHWSLFQAKHHVSNPSVRYRFSPCAILVPSKKNVYVVTRPSFDVLFIIKRLNMLTQTIVFNLPPPPPFVKPTSILFVTNFYWVSFPSKQIVGLEFWPEISNFLVHHEFPRICSWALLNISLLDIFKWCIMRIPEKARRLTRDDILSNYVICGSYWWVVYDVRG